MKTAQTGFTLVEIAIVLVIVGVLMGGILKGQELIASARLKSLAQDFRSIPLLIHSYQERFRALPGDDPAASGHLCPSATAGCTTAGDGNGVIGGDWRDVAASEAFLFWQHVRLAGFASGPTAPADPAYLPRNAEGGRIGVQGGGATAPLGVRGNHVICSSGIAARHVGPLDAQLDDGNPATGAMRAGTDNGGGLSPVSGMVSADDAGSFVVCLGV